MKAARFPGAIRSARRAFAVRGRRRTHLEILQCGAWWATVRVVGIGTVRVPTVATQRGGA